MTALEDAYKTLKVLVVDEPEASRAAIGGMLQRLGITTISQAGTAPSGLHELVRIHPDVVLCDIVERPNGGPDLLHMIRSAADEWLHTIPVICLSSSRSLDALSGAAHQHSDGYLVKPFTIDDLKQQLDNIITRLSDRRRTTTV